MKFVNLTPHSIRVYKADTCTKVSGNFVANSTSEVVLEIEASGIVARAAQSAEECQPLCIGGNTIPVWRIAYGEPQDLPKPVDGVVLIVSALAANSAAAHGRDTKDLLVPYGLVRDEKGAVVGCTWFSQV